MMVHAPAPMALWTWKLVAIVAPWVYFHESVTVVPLTVAVRVFGGRGVKWTPWRFAFLEVVLAFLSGPQWWAPGCQFQDRYNVTKRRASSSHLAYISQEFLLFGRLRTAPPRFSIPLSADSRPLQVDLHTQPPIYSLAKINAKRLAPAA